MILETIFLWLGGIEIIGLLLLGILYTYFQLYNWLIFNFRISLKAIFYWLISERIQKRRDKNRYYDLHKIQVYHTYYKGKRYEWKLNKIGDFKK
jgi:hypothetical protein